MAQISEVGLVCHNSFLWWVKWSRMPLRQLHPAHPVCQLWACRGFLRGDPFLNNHPSNTDTHRVVSMTYLHLALWKSFESWGHFDLPCHYSLTQCLAHSWCSIVVLTKHSFLSTTERKDPCLLNVPIGKFFPITNPDSSTTEGPAASFLYASTDLFQICCLTSSKPTASFSSSQIIALLSLPRIFAFAFFSAPPLCFDILWLCYHSTRRTCGLVGLEIRREMGSCLECAIFQFCHLSEAVSSSLKWSFCCPNKFSELS